MIGQVLDIMLGVAVLAAAAVAVFARRRMVASMTFLVLGLLLALVWARLRAPDITLAEAAIASGVTGALIVGAVTEHPAAVPRDRRRLLMVLEAVVGAALAGALAVAFVTALRDGAALPRLGERAREATPDSPVSHPVTAVLLDFRAYDTLLEIAVLTAAALGALALQRSARRVALPTDTRAALSAFVGFTVPVILLAAGWFLVAGSTRTGGAFQAGAMAAGALLLLYLNARIDLTKTGRWLAPAASAGLAVFLLAAVGTLLLGNGWLVIEQPWGGALILTVETVLTLSIGVALATLFVAGFPDRPDRRRR